MIYFGSWQPDRGRGTQAVSLNILNAIPRLGDGSGAPDWGPFAGPAAVTGASALPANPKGTAIVINPSSQSYEFYVGTTDSLYKLSTTYGWTQIGTGYALPDGDFWSIIQFGEHVLFTNITDGILDYNMVTPAGVNPLANAPKARSLAVMFNCVFAFSCDGDPLLIRNSAINDHTEWTPNVNGANYQPLPDGEELVGGAYLPNRIGVVFQRDKYSLLLPDPQLLYSLSEQDFGSGAVGHQAIVRAGSRAYFRSSDGFFYTEGGAPVRIGEERVDRTFLASMADTASLATVQGALDRKNRMVWFRYKTPTDTSADITSGMIGIHLELDQWAPAQVTMAGMFSFNSPGISIDDITDPLDSIPRSLDSRFYLGGLSSFACLDENLKVATFDGANLAATLDTPIVPTPVSILSRGCKPQYVGTRSGATVQVGVSNFLGDVPVYSDAAPIEASGTARPRGRGMNIGYRLNVAAGVSWTSARGVDFADNASGGKR